MWNSVKVHYTDFNTVCMSQIDMLKLYKSQLALYLMRKTLSSPDPQVMMCGEIQKYQWIQSRSIFQIKKLIAKLSDSG